MHLQQLAALAAITRIASASAVLPRIPKETGVFQFPFDQITPIPTGAPDLPLELLKRADEKTTVFVAPDNICGYISDLPGASFFCPADFNCILFPAQSTFSGNIACCNGASCNARLTCLDFNQISSSSACNDACKVDAFTLKCSDSKLPFCNTASFSGNIIDYWCNDVEISTPQSADTTFSGQSRRESFSPLVLGDSTTSGDLGFTLNTSDQESATAAPPEVDTDGGDGGGEPRKKKTNKGAIAGGVVGGVAVIGLIGAGAYLLFRKKKGQDTDPHASIPPTVSNAATTFPPNSPMAQSPYGPPGGVAAQYGSAYDANYAAQMQQQQGQYGAAPPNSGYKPEYGQYYAPGQQPSPGTGMMAVPIDRNDSTSPMTDPNRLSNTTGTGGPLQSPTPSQLSNFTNQGYMQAQPYPQGQPYPQPQPTIHEAATNQVDHHRGQMHELA